MILCHIRSLTAGFTKELHGKVNLKNSILSITTKNKNINLSLEVADIKNKHQDKDVCLIVYLSKNDEIGILVYPKEDKSTLADLRYLTEMQGIIYAYIPKEANSWLDSNVRVLTRENKDTLDKEYNLVQVFYNEFENIVEENKVEEVINFFIKGGNPWLKAYAIFGGIEINEKKI